MALLFFFEPFSQTLQAPAQSSPRQSRRVLGLIFLEPLIHRCFGLLKAVLVCCSLQPGLGDTDAGIGDELSLGRPFRQYLQVPVGVSDVTVLQLPRQFIEHVLPEVRMGQEDE